MKPGKNTLFLMFVSLNSPQRTLQLYLATYQGAQTSSPEEGQL
jgi:hypothetical protein